MFTFTFSCTVPTKIWIPWIIIWLLDETSFHQTLFFRPQTDSNLFRWTDLYHLTTGHFLSYIEKVKAVLTTWFMTWMYRFFSTLKNAFCQQNTNRGKRRFSVEEEKNCLFPSNACFAAKYWYNILSFFSAQKRALSCIQWRLLCSIEKWKCRRENAGETFANLIPILKGRGCCQ